MSRLDPAQPYAAQGPDEGRLRASEPKSFRPIRPEGLTLPADGQDAYFIFIENPRGGAPRMQVLPTWDEFEAQELAASALFGELGDECGHVYRGEVFVFSVYPAPVSFPATEPPPSTADIAS